MLISLALHNSDDMLTVNPERIEFMVAVTKDDEFQFLKLHLASGAQFHIAALESEVAAAIAGVGSEYARPAFVPSTSTKTV